MSDPLSQAIDDVSVVLTHWLRRLFLDGIRLYLEDLRYWVARHLTWSWLVAYAATLLALLGFRHRRRSKHGSQADGPATATRAPAQ